MSRDDEVVGVESSNDGTSDEESVNDKAQELFMEEISKLMDAHIENIKSEFLTVRTRQNSFNLKMKKLQK